ncbi:uncharacterized protein LOC126660698 isoform X2 [Mercurialis annua]|uniref:uncharacterized protein LOC126660698 isoform X2 n=1 Tax=Mercurialis annua TaxID=3986 RepID=UPI002160F2EF|nr:uncharacterized protein LOC126660698 isoform X2 [Mercurialis annua]
MMSGVRQSNAVPKPSGVEVRKGSKQQQSSKIVKEKALPTQPTQSLKRQDLSKAKAYISKQYGGIDDEIKSSGNCRQLADPVRSQTDDELVRYMSNLPGYLQRVERTEKKQDNALNVGVLDWERLESWKCHQKGIPAGVGNIASLPRMDLSAKRPPAYYSPPPQYSETSSKLPLPPCRYYSSHKDGISRNAKSSFHDVESASKSHFDGQKRALWTYKSFHRSSPDTTSEKGKRRESDYKLKTTSKVESWSSSSRYNKMLTEPRESVSSFDREAKQRIEVTQESDIKRKSLKQNSTQSVESSSSKLRSYESSLVTKEKKNFDYRTKKIPELQEPACNLPHQHQADKSKSIVLLLPGKIPQATLSKEPRRSMDEHVTGAIQDSLTEGFSDNGIFSSELHSEFPHSCPLPSRMETNTDQQETTLDANNTQDSDLSSYAMRNARSSIENSGTLDQELTELAARKSRHPSPNRRFSFSLGRMTRSFSFKDSSAVPQLISTYVSSKSGPVIPKASSVTDNSNREKASGHNRVKSSPLRRILDPLLKSRGSSLPNSAGSDQSSRGSIDSCSYNPISAAVSLQNEKRESSSIQAHLMLLRSNGFPLYRFVINQQTILVATPMKNLTSPWKTGQGCNYVLYSIDEIKRKSGSWMNQVGKERNCGFVYNVVGQMMVGQMMVSDSSLLNFSGRTSNVKESVLFGVDQRQKTGQTSAEIKPNTELAAVVLQKPSENLCCGRPPSNKDFMEKGSMPEDKHFNNYTVILPGGVHSLPSKGVPSSLIHRWKSGGSCDCGGWDVGCKLRIFSNENQHQKLQRESDPSLMSDCFELFVQGEPQHDTHIFSMAPVEKGKYSIEFSPSISSLQAFFICVSVLSCQTFPDINEMNLVCEEKAVQDSGNGDVPTKYTPSPPISPVGRV